MFDLFFTGYAIWFSIPAFVGSLIFLGRMALMTLGSHGGDFGDHAIGHGGGHAHGDADHGDSGEAFRLLTLEGITASMMGFGWGGLAALKGTDWTLSYVMLTAIGCGLAMIWLQALLLRGVYKLQASGNVSIKDTLGTQGVVYVAIPGESKGKGQVTLVINQRQRQFNAITPGEGLPSQTRVNVVSVNEDNTVTVLRAG